MEDQHAKTTHHAKERLKERAGLNEEASERMAEKALEHGMKHTDATGRLKAYFDHLFFKDRKANNIRIYGQIVYIFCDNVLVTALTLPLEHKKAVKKFFDKQKQQKETEMGNTKNANGNKNQPKNQPQEKRTQEEIIKELNKNECPVVQISKLLPKDGQQIYIVVMEVITEEKKSFIFRAVKQSSEAEALGTVVFECINSASRLGTYNVVELQSVLFDLLDDQLKFNAYERIFRIAVMLGLVDFVDNGSPSSPPLSIKWEDAVKALSVLNVI